VIPFLYPSRYCQSDKLGRLAFSKFGQIKNPFEKVTAISEWIHQNVQYLSGTTNWQTSAYDTVAERAGVCRDFAHLGIALCRALNIPARYFAGYAHQLTRPDFHACFEAYIGRCWLLFDPTRLAPLNGLVRIATGRDAADASVATIFGPTRSASVQVSCEVLDGAFKPVAAVEVRNGGICADAS
jgi:transglutaminase-like putative cysteine protease